MSEEAIEKLKEAREKWLEKLGRFELELAIESDVGHKFQLINKIEECEKQYKKLQRFIEELELQRRDESLVLNDVKRWPKEVSIYRYKRQRKCFKQDLGEGVILTLMNIPAGEFLMGAPESAPESFNSQRPQHRVKLESFLMGCYPVTQAQWRVVANYLRVERDLDSNPSIFTGENLPVENVSWDYATEFCKRLSAKTGLEYRLPSEAEWEYACRSGTETPFHFGETIMTELANYNGNYRYNNEGSKGEYRKTTTEVGSFPANEWGLHDMHGNVWEWCEDDWHDNYEGAPNNGTAWIDENRTGTGRVFRGGSYFSNPRHCSSAFRDNGTRITLINDIGFRVVCHLPFP